MPRTPTTTAKKGNGGLTSEQKLVLNREFLSVASVMLSRAGLAERLGKSYYGRAEGGTAKRDLYKTLGYEVYPIFQTYYARYRRQDIAKTVVSAYPNACWRLKPTVSDAEEAGTPFEQELSWIIRERKVWHYLARADRISGIGEYGIVLMGFDDGGNLRQPLGKARELVFLRPYTQENVSILSLVEDPRDPRYGQPEIYQISTGSDEKDEDGKEVHHSRVIHIAEEMVEDDIHGTPRMECCLNRLQDLELVAGGSGEMFWRGAFPGMAFQAQPDAEFDAQAMDALEDEIQDYLHELRRYIRLQGIEIQQLQPQVSDPTQHIDIILTLIAAAARIPKRILLGSERGELASSQDERAWLDRVDERRRDHVEPTIVRPFVDALISTGVIPPPPSEDYTVEWPPLFVAGEKERLEGARTAADALSKYFATPGLADMMPFEIFLTKYLGFSDDEIIQVKDLVGGELNESFQDIDEEEEEGAPPAAGTEEPEEEEVVVEEVE